MTPIRTLEVADEAGRLLIRLSWRLGCVSVDSVVTRHSDAVQRWVSQGLLEWVGAPGDETPRETPSSSELFLPRLGNYLERQFPALRIQHASHLDLSSGLALAGLRPVAAASTSSAKRVPLPAVA